MVSMRPAEYILIFIIHMLHHHPGILLLHERSLPARPVSEQDPHGSMTR